MEYLDKKSFDSFKKIKKKLLKLYPGAATKIDGNGKFYLIDKNGFKILKDEFDIPNCNTIREAWEKTLSMLWTQIIVIRNNNKFSDDKIIKQSKKLL